MLRLQKASTLGCVKQLLSNSAAMLRSKVLRLKPRGQYRRHCLNRVLCAPKLWDVHHNGRGCRLELVGGCSRGEELVRVLFVDQLPGNAARSFVVVSALQGHRSSVHPTMNSDLPKSLAMPSITPEWGRSGMPVTCRVRGVADLVAEALTWI
jgi:hypothetical protein